MGSWFSYEGTKFTVSANFEQPRMINRRCDDETELFLRIKPIMTATDELVVRELVRRKADINSTRYRGETPFKRATMSQQHRIMCLLHQKGAEINTVSQIDGLTPLKWALHHGTKETIFLLLDLGVDRLDCFDYLQKNLFNRPDAHEIAERL